MKRKQKKTLYERFKDQKVIDNEYIEAGEKFNENPEKLIIKKVSGFGKMIEAISDGITLIFKILCVLVITLLVSFALTVLINASTREAVFQILRGPL